MQEQHPGGFTWSLVDTTTPEGLSRLRRLRRGASGQIPVPSILADGEVVFPAVPDLEDLDDWMTANLPAGDADPPTTPGAADDAPPSRKDAR